MKKLIFTFVIMLVMGLTSCGTKSETNVEATNCSCDSVCTCNRVCNCDTNIVDTIAVDSIQ